MPPFQQKLGQVIRQLVLLSAEHVEREWLAVTVIICSCPFRDGVDQILGIGPVRRLQHEHDFFPLEFAYGIFRIFAI
jgi:hypothetical protein